MDNPNRVFARFFGVIGSPQAYLNVLYLFLAFPLGIFYFVFLVTGFAAGIPLLIIWIGLPLLALVAGGWWLMALFERQMAIWVLKEEIGPMISPAAEGEDWVTRLKTYLTNPVTWKSLLYLFLKFPLGILTFVVLVTLAALTGGFLSAPLTYQFFHFTVNLGPDVAVWQIDTLNEALAASLIGLLLWPVSLHILNGLAWVSGKFAKYMLGLNPKSPVQSAKQPQEVPAET